MEEILLKAGEKMGWKGKRHDKYKTEFSLGSVHENEVCWESELRFRGLLFPEITVDRVYEDTFYGGPRASITVWDKSVFGIGKKKKIKKFLSYVSEYVADME